MNFSTKIPGHVAGYLATVNGITARPGLTDEEKDRPFFSVFCEDWESAHRRCWAGDITVRLLSTGEATADADAALLDAVRGALQDNAAFDAYMFSLPRSERLGWKMTKFALSSGGVSVDGADSTRDHDITLRVAVIY